MEPRRLQITFRQCAKAQALAAAFGVEGKRRGTPMSPAAQADLHAARTLTLSHSG
jgi:hypothetical protein